MRFFLNLVLIIVLLSSCQKDNNVPAQPDKVKMNITSPTAGRQYKKGDTLHINADVSYISQLHGYEVKIIDIASGDVIYDAEGHVHGASVNIDERWVDTLSVAKTLKVQIAAIIDHDKNTSIKEIVVNSQP